VEGSSLPLLVRHEFLIRRLHSLSGLVPIGAYLVLHLVTNASVLSGPGTYQANVYKIYSLGVLLPFIEWALIFFPILFHAIVGVVIVLGMAPNTSSYPYMANWRYVLQRWTGVIAFAFILWHVFHMRGWFHNELWLTYVEEPLGGARFRPYNAASTAGLALQNPIVVALYAIGILSAVYHLANGIWSSGITWGVWTSPPAQSRALSVCGVFGILLSMIGLGALGSLHTVGRGDALQNARGVEDRMYQHLVGTGEILPNPHRRAESIPVEEDSAAEVNRIEAPPTGE
jgi:succinate dehydrogenase / fumarate reductase cytochrome b subunit